MESLLSLHSRNVVRVIPGPEEGRKGSSSTVASSSRAFPPLGQRSVRSSRT